jgi:hypothetical protein
MRLAGRIGLKVYFASIDGAIVLLLANEADSVASSPVTAESGHGTCIQARGAQLTRYHGVFAPASSLRPRDLPTDRVLNYDSYGHNF